MSEGGDSGVVLAEVLGGAGTGSAVATPEAVIAYGQIHPPHLVGDGRTREGREALAILDRLLIEALREQQPASVRNVFYRAVDPTWLVHVPKTEDGYRLILRRLLKLRREGEIPYSWVADHGRRAWRTATYNDAGEFMRTVAGLYRSDVWGDHGQRAEVWVESRSLAGSIEGTCRELAVSLFPCGGAPSETFVYDAAEATCREWSPLTVFYIGDYDGPGQAIAENTRRKLLAFIGGEVDVEWRHLGVDQAMIEAYGLPTRPHKPTNLRNAPPVAVEAEALAAADWRRIVRREVEALLPDGAFLEAKAAEESEQRTLIDMAEALHTAEDEE